MPGIPNSLSRRSLVTGAFSVLTLRAARSGATREPDPCATAGSSASLAPPGEPGERLTVSGRVVAADGVTPAAGVVLYAYHTDAQGAYAWGLATKPRLRGWMRTGPDGRYLYVTIRPAPYPGRRIPAHIHTQLWGPGVPPQWGTDLNFEDDPLVTEEVRRRSAALGPFAYVRPLEKRADGLHATHDLRLKPTGDTLETRHGLDGCGLA